MIGEAPDMIALSAPVVVLFLLQLPQPPAPAVETLRARVELIHDLPGAAVRGVRLHRADTVAHFFQARGFVPAWTIPEGAEEIRASILRLEEDGLSPALYHLAAIDALLPERQSAPGPVLDDDLQIILTDAVAALLDHVRHGRVDPASLDAQWNIDPREGTLPVEFLLEQAASAPSPAGVIEALKPSHFVCTGLKEALARLRAAAAGIGWPEVPGGPALKPGADDPRVPALRRRLAATGELLPGASLDSQAFDEELAGAVRTFQDRHRLAPDGVVGPATRQALNVSAAAGADQVRANLERIRWLSAVRPRRTQAP